jgi:hypothetical protein
MAIKFSQPPKESVNALMSTLRGLSVSPGYERISPLRDFDVRSLGGAEPSLPHRVFSLGFDDLRKGAGLKDARLVSWSYFVPRGAHSPASAEVNVDDSGRHKFAQLNTGPFNESIRAAFNSLMKDSRLANRSYDPRVLRIPALYVTAIWLKSDEPKEDFVVPVAPAIPALVAGQFYPVPEFENIVRKTASEKKTTLEGQRESNA